MKFKIRDLRLTRWLRPPVVVLVVLAIVLWAFLGSLCSFCGLARLERRLARLFTDTDGQPEDSCGGASACRGEAAEQSPVLASRHSQIANRKS